MNEHIILFDGACGFCHRALQHVVRIDVDHRFLFASLNGQTANDILCGPHESLRKINSPVIVENYASASRRFWIRLHAILRVYWLVGHGWSLIGILSFLPSSLGDAIYFKLAKHRHQFKLKPSEIPIPKDRFLP